MQYSEAEYLGLANRHWTIGIAALLVAFCSGSIGLYLFSGDLYSERQIRQLTENAYKVQRPGGGRLFAAPYSPLAGAANFQQDVGRAQVLLLRFPESQTRRQLQGTVYLASGNWRAFVDNVDRLSPELRQDPGTANDLGVSYLALSEVDPTYLLKALDQFERAAELDPKAPEPRFNLVIAYRKLRLGMLAKEMLQRYTEVDSGSIWQHELTSDSELEESATLAELSRAVESGNLSEAERLFDKDPELYRRAAMQFGLFNVGVSQPLVRFIGEQIQRRYGDKTILAMLAPLFTNRRTVTVAVRDFVRQGAELYLQGNNRGSLEAYSKAERLISPTDSAFDRLWIDVNRVDTQIRSGEFETATESLRNIISSAHQHQFTWLEAKALSIYGSTPRITPSYSEILRLLSQAEHMFSGIGASYDRVRPLYYLAAYRYGAGDQDEALRLAMECLRLTDDSDFVRMSSLDLLIGSILYRQGMPQKALLFDREALEQTQHTKNATLETGVASTLTQLYESLSERTLAEHYLKVAEDALEEVESGIERARSDAFFEMVKARIALNRKHYKDTESILEKNLKIYAQQPFVPNSLRSQALMLLAQTYAETGRITEATRKFNEAIEIVENDDQYLVSEKLRVKFDDDRRELYDSAIEFEYSTGSPDAAWTYLQQYRAKLFLEFLAQFDPDINRLRSRAIDRSKVQKLVPHDSQVVEYALLKDRLLIWLISDNLFTLRSVPVTRSDLESKVQTVLQKLRNEEDADSLLEELGNLLIEPVADLLDPNRTIAFIPDRALHGLPFAALRRPGKKEYLIQNFPIIISPSLTHLLATSATRPDRNAIVGFGSQNDDSSEMRELRALNNIYSKVRTFAGEGIDKARFLSEMNTAPVVHYAGHSATDAVDPLRSSILLDGNRYGPNSVTAVDISEQRLWKNAVVVLSSCDSSVGNARDGVGMRGLTSAFLIGGAGSVVGSLWPVEASSTADLMISFHRAFAAGQMPVAKALREAQLAFLESFPERLHPYYWSGFEVTGNFSALK
jgi:CHAT domain-containing protein